MIAGTLSLDFTGDLDRITSLTSKELPLDILFFISVGEICASIVLQRADYSLVLCVVANVT